MILYRVHEREATSVPIDLVFSGGALDIRPDVQSSKYFDISLRGSELVVRAGKFVGFVPLNERVALEVSPRFPRANLLRMLLVAGGDVRVLYDTERLYDFDDSAFHVPPLFRAIAGTFLRAVTNIETEGLLKRYLAHVYAGAPRGRVSMESTVRTHWSRGHRDRLTSTAATLTADIPENQVLLTASQLLLNHLNVIATTPGIHLVTGLAHFSALMERAGVRPVRGNPHHVTDLGRLSPSYREALTIADAILRGRGIAIPESGMDITLSSILVDMESLFERYVRMILSTWLTTHVVLDGNTAGAKSLFDDRASPRAQPDIVIKTRRQPVLIGEVKYKPSYSREDINQILAYALSYRCPKVVLLLPVVEGAEAQSEIVGEVDGRTVHVVRLDLGSAPVGTAEKDFVRRISAILQA